MLETRFGQFLIVAMLISTVIVSRDGLVSANPTTTLAVPIIVDKTLRPGSTFSANITVSEVQKLWGCQFILSYDTSVLTAIDYGFYSPFKNPLPSEINDTAGYVALSASTYMGDPDGFTIISPVPVARIDFLVDSKGTSVLDIHNSSLADIYGTWIDHNVLDGFFANVHTKVPDITPTRATPPQPGYRPAENREQTTGPSGNRSILCIAPSASDRWYAQIQLTETYCENGISAGITIHENNIASSSIYDMVASVIGVGRYNPSYGDFEWIEVGSRQDSRGLFLFGAYQQPPGRWIETKLETHITSGETHFLEIRSTADRYWAAFIDGNYVTEVVFSSDVTAERIAVAQHESSDPTNTLRGYLWNLIYYDANWNPHNWQQISTHQDEPYYARFDATKQFSLLDPSIQSTIRGDGDLNYIVGLLDSALVSAHWDKPSPDSHLGPLGWSSTVDFNHDGKVNVFDSSIVSSHWNQGW